MHLPSFTQGPAVTNMYKRKAGALEEPESGSDDEPWPQPARFPAIDPPARDDDCFSEAGSSDSTDSGVAPARQPPAQRRGNGNIAQGLFPRHSWHFLLALLNPHVRSYKDFQRVTGTSRANAGSFSRQVRKLGACSNVVDLPVLDTSHPAVRRALLDIHRTLVPLAVRSPVPPRPQKPRDGTRSLMRFLHMQPRDEWFTTEELELHFDSGGRKHWVLGCMRSHTQQGCVEVRDMHEKPRRYRIDPRSRDALAIAARDVAWKDLLPDRQEPPPCNPPPATHHEGVCGEAFAEHLRSRGLDDGRPATPEAALDFLAARGIAGRPLLPCPAIRSAAELLRTLADRQCGRAILCLPGDARYVEAWREASGFWRARHLTDAPGAPDGQPLWLHALLAAGGYAQDLRPAQTIVFDA